MRSSDRVMVNLNKKKKKRVRERKENLSNSRLVDHRMEIKENKKSDN